MARLRAGAVTVIDRLPLPRECAGHAGIAREWSIVIQKASSPITLPGIRSLRS
jgi:hypothetical protein